MSTVSAREANQNFSRLLDAAARGEEVTITRRGKAVAKLVPVAGTAMEDDEAAARKIAEREAILARFEKGFVGKRLDNWTRDELYEERHERSRRPDTCE